MNKTNTADTAPSATGVTPTATGRRPSRTDRELTELLQVAARILPEYSDKLGRLVQSALTIWDQREKSPAHPTETVGSVVVRSLDNLLQTALVEFGGEFRALSEPLREWIHKLSAALEERPITEVQKMELRLRLAELEMKYHTAQTIFSQLGVL